MADVEQGLDQWPDRDDRHEPVGVGHEAFTTGVQRPLSLPIR